MWVCVQDVNWTEHPAQSILAVTTKGKYVVKCQGLGIHDYGLIDAAAAKRQCNSGSEASGSAPPALTADIINEFESNKKAFEKDTMAHMTSRELDLGAISLCTMFRCIFATAACYTAPGCFHTCAGFCNHRQQCNGFADELDEGSLLETCAFLVRSHAACPFHWKSLGAVPAPPPELPCPAVNGSGV